VKRVYSLLKATDGSIAVTMVILMFAFVGLLAFGIDLAHLQTVKNELQNAADACALRGARAFLPDTMPITGVYTGDPNDTSAQQQAYNTILMNRSDNVNFQLGDLSMGDIQVGIWNYETRSWVGGSPSWSWPPDPSLWGHYIGPGVTLPARRNSLNSLGPVAMTLARLFGINTVNVSARATAALSGAGTADQGTPGIFPIAVDTKYLTAPGDTIFFSPANADVGGWTSLTLVPASVPVFQGLIDGTRGIGGPVTIGTNIGLQNGVACAVIKYAIDYYSSDPGTTEVAQGVYQLNQPVQVKFPAVTVDQYNQTARVEGWLTANILYFIDSNATKGITIILPNGTSYVTDGNCDLIIQAVEGTTSDLSGGGPWYGLLSTQPKLVQ
jgi:hypothetical protein